MFLYKKKKKEKGRTEICQGAFHYAVSLVLFHKCLLSFAPITDIKEGRYVKQETLVPDSYAYTV